MNLKDLKLNLFHVRKATFVYKKPLAYLRARYLTAPKLIRAGRVLEREVTARDVSIHMLLGSRDLVQAVWSLASFYRVSNIIGPLFIHADQTTSEGDMAKLRRLFPSATIRLWKEYEPEVCHALEAYPTLHGFRATYQGFQSKKLLDTFFASEAEKCLLLDSDILWFLSPEQLEEACRSGEAVMMSNGTEVYTRYKEGTLIEAKLARYNSGVVLYKRSDFDLRKLQSFLEKFDYMKNRFIDQIALGFVLGEPKMLDANTYVIKKYVDEHTVMRHYTSPRRALLFIEGVQRLSRALLG